VSVAKSCSRCRWLRLFSSGRADSIAPVFFKRNTTVQVWTIGEGFGIGSERTCCAANNFRDHDLTSPLNSLPLPDPTHALWIGSDISPI
jgi:hypothetical protein